MATKLLKAPLVIGGITTLGIGAMAYTFYSSRKKKIPNIEVEQKKEDEGAINTEKEKDDDENSYSYGELDNNDNDEDEETQKPSNNYLPHLKLMLGKETVEMLSLDKTWGDLVDRVHSEFYVLCKDYFEEFATNVAGVVAFLVSLKVNKNMTFGTPRLFRQKLHPVIESIRKMRFVVEKSAPSALMDFDELAAEIQRTHDDAANNIQLEATSGTGSYLK
jgi:hypothetical protein